MLLLCSFIENVFQSLIDLKSLVLGSLDTNNTNIGCAWQFHLTLRSKHNYLLLNIIHTNIIALNSINFVVTLFSIKTKRSPILISFNYTRTYLWLNTYSRPMYRPHIIYFTNCTCFFLYDKIYSGYVHQRRSSPNETKIHCLFGFLKLIA